MLSRKLERSMEIKDCIEVKCFRPFVLEYYLLESRIDDGELEGKTAYGVEIVKLEGREPIENAAVRNYSCSRESAQELLCKLADNSVTPVSLHYILDDIVGV